jgi:hypothetical protein
MRRRPRQAQTPSSDPQAADEDSDIRPSKDKCRAEQSSCTHVLQNITLSPFTENGKVPTQTATSLAILGWLSGHKFPALLACVAGCIPYYNVGKCDFVFDDIFAIKENKDVMYGGWDVFLHDFWGQDISKRDSHKSYRPVTTLSFHANYAFSVRYRQMCLCVRVCAMYVCIHVSIWAHAIETSDDAFILAQIMPFLSVNVYLHAYICLCARVYVCTYVRAFTYLLCSIHLFIYIHTFNCVFFTTSVAPQGFSPTSDDAFIFAPIMPYL